MTFPTIGVVVQLQSSIQEVRKSARFIQEQVEVGVGWDEDTVIKTANRFRDIGVRAIVARGPWSQMITDSTGLPVFDYNPTSHDFLQALCKARSISRVVGVTDAYGFDEDWKAFEEALGITILVSPQVVDPPKLGDYLRQVYNAGARVLVGGQLTLREADRLGIPAVYLESGEKALRTALSKAEAYVKGLKAEQERAQILQTVLDNIQEGIIAFGTSGRVVLTNKVAAQLIGRADLSPGCHLSELLPFWGEVVDLLENNTAVADEVRTINGRKVVTDLTPIVVDGTVTDGVVLLQEFGRVRKTEEAIRKSLYGRGFVAHHSFSDIIGESPSMKRAIRTAKQYARSRLAVLLIGETGTGKELFAQSIHSESKRANGPFVAVNCAALPENLLESELFGYEEGAFTGAKKGGKPGLFEMAHGGTIFLDEISAMSLPMQAKLLRVLEEQTVVRLGGDRITHLNVRLIAASNVDLEGLIEEGKFREDLYFRLAVLILRIPPLREREGDVGLLLKHFLRSAGSKCLEGLSESLPELEHQRWPGNVRELENFAQRYEAFLETGATTAEAADSALNKRRRPLEVSSQDTAHWESGIAVRPSSLEEMMGQVLRQVAERHQGALDPLAQRLGVSKSGLWKMLRRYGISTVGGVKGQSGRGCCPKSSP